MQCEGVIILAVAVLSYLPLIIEVYDISQNSFYLYSVYRILVSGERSRANGPLVRFKHVLFLFLFLDEYYEKAGCLLCESLQTNTWRVQESILKTCQKFINRFVLFYSV